MIKTDIQHRIRTEQFHELLAKKGCNPTSSNRQEVKKIS